MVNTFEPFKTKLPNFDNRNSVYISWVNALLKFEHNDFFDTSSKTATIYYTLEPEVQEWGLERITINISKLHISFEWSVDVEELTAEEKAILIAAGGFETRHETIEATVDMTIENGVDEWEFTWEDCSFSKTGAFEISYVDVDFKDKVVSFENSLA